MRITPFYRVSDCLSAVGTKTSVCLKLDRLAQLQHYAYGCRSTVNKAIRAASRELAALPSRAAEAQASVDDSWSQAVVDRALAKLTGAYNPEKAVVLDAVAEQLAAENNAAWSA
jgi:hypothetical protein